MKNNRRKFLKLSGLTGIGALTGMVAKGKNANLNPEDSFVRNPYDYRCPPQNFNMCGFAAPQLNTVRIGIIGLGDRGPDHLDGLIKIEGVEIKALCDVRPEFAEKAKKSIAGKGHSPVLYTANNESWKELCNRDDLDVVYIATPWDMHTSMALYAMEHGKHAFVEVPAAVTIDECWQLVETSERTRKYCRMLENACYGALTTLNMARQGFFGEIVHGEGGYLHNLIARYLFKKDQYWDMWRLKENARRNGDLYPTHGLGPVCQIMDINRGNCLDYLVSMSSDDFNLSEKAKELAEKDAFFKPFADKKFRGNMNTCIIRTKKGQTIKLSHDVSSPNIHSAWHRIVGSKGTRFSAPRQLSNGGEQWLSDKEADALEKKYEPAIVTKIGELAKRAGGHGGIDFIQNWFLIDSLKNGLPLDQDVYDAALWSAIAPLSEWSVEHFSSPIKIPDFTRGSWITNPPFDISLSKGGNTNVKI